MIGAVALAALIGVVAALYASVGLAGATGYLALLALFGVDAAPMKGAALLLNTVVAAIGTAVFARPGTVRAGEFAAIGLPAVPTAFLGGLLRLPDGIYLPVVGLVLLASAARLLRPPAGGPGGGAGPSLGASVAIGAAVGFASGITGTGGGIFLLPALQLLGRVGPREASALVAPFVLVTSAAALGGHLWRSGPIPEGLASWVPAAMIGGFLGARAGRDRLDPRTLRRILAGLLVVAGVKLLAS